MKPRHAAALALVAWVMMPLPLRAAGGPIAVPGTADVQKSWYLMSPFPMRPSQNSKRPRSAYLLDIEKGIHVTMGWINREPFLVMYVFERYLYPRPLARRESDPVFWAVTKKPALFSTAPCYYFAVV
jgi:hypothetical protein